jgi:flagellar biosynthetic protein FlhB
MMQAVPDADVVITNPTHYAVALVYKHIEMTAPKVVAKGQRKIAEKIKELAYLHHVPIVEEPHLARALFFSTEINEEIPFEFYQAVAEILANIYQVKGFYKEL